MNHIHRLICRSGWWRGYVERDLLPWVLQGIELGDESLEVGPGPGLTTASISRLAPRLTALEFDTQLASTLRGKAIRNVTVVEGDATAMPFPEGHFSSVLSFTMLHHVPSSELQDRLLKEAFRVLRPGGVFAGSDSLWSFLFGLVHIGDTMVMVNPDEFAPRLEKVGFFDVRVERGRKAFRFRALKPQS